jgi:hypothetical protein
MTPDLQGYKATKFNARSPFLAPKLLGRCSLSSPGFFPTPDRSSAAYRPPPATCWYDLHHRPHTPLLSVDFPCGILPLSLFLYSWLFLTGGSVCSHLLTLVPRSRIFLPWRWRRYVPPKCRLTQDLHGATSQKTTFFIVTAVKASNRTNKISVIKYKPKALFEGKKHTCRFKGRTFISDFVKTEPLVQNLKWGHIRQYQYLFHKWGTCRDPRLPYFGGTIPILRAVLRVPVGYIARHTCTAFRNFWIILPDMLFFFCACCIEF